MIEFLDSIYDEESPWSRVERYEMTYEERLLDVLVKGSGGAA